MLKYVDTKIVFQEIPDEITLCINISNCPCYCEGCHSSYLAKDIGKELNVEAIDNLIETNNEITCICIMGGDVEPLEVNEIAHYIKEYYPELKVAWYSGRQELSKEIKLNNFNFIKLGPYIKERGPLNSKTTNQVMLEIDVINNKVFTKDITSRFWN